MDSAADWLPGRDGCIRKEKTDRGRGGNGGNLSRDEGKRESDSHKATSQTNFHIYPFSNPISTLSSNTVVLLIIPEVWFALRHFKSGKLREEANPLASAPRHSQLGYWFGHTWQGSSHFAPRHPGAQVHVPSRVLQAPPWRHWHVKLQPKPHVPLGQLMEQSTPCQPAMTRTQSV